MPLSDWTRIISTSVVPVAIISASALLSLAFYNRLNSIVGRLRNFQRERLREYEEYAEHLRSGQQNASTVDHHRQVLEMLEIQTKRVYRRARLIRRGLICVLAAIACLTVCSLTMAMALIIPNAELVARYVAEVMFIAGMILLVTGDMFAIGELWGSLDPVHLESQFVTGLARQIERDASLIKLGATQPEPNSEDL